MQIIKFMVAGTITPAFLLAFQPAFFAFKSDLKRRVAAKKTNSRVDITCKILYSYGTDF